MRQVTVGRYEWRCGKEGDVAQEDNALTGHLQIAVVGRVAAAAGDQLRCAHVR